MILKLTWREGYVFDLWSLVHLVSGVFASVVGWYFEYSFILIFIAVLGVAVGWELFEMLRKVFETKTNRIADIFCALIGCGIGFFTMKEFALSEPSTLIMGFILVILLGILNVIGWQYRTEFT